ncbi:MAG TPA: FAD-dependent oxidoreductase [Kofleriaceae bacterium]|nr:FAD-dependent oxidoreductase [Kofleriaceae bacterium]
MGVGPSRRDFVAMLLGAPLAAAWACGGEARRVIPARLIDTGMARGHAVARDHRITAPPTRWREHAVVIVGAGVAGLAAAWELRRRGVRDVVIFELDDVTGGTARGGESVVTRYPWGAHYIVAPQRDQVDLIALLGELGAIERTEADGTPVIDEALRCREPEERVFYRGRWYEGLYLDAGATADDRRQLAAFRAEIDRWSAWRDGAGRSAFTIPMRRSTDAAEVTALDQISFATWLDRRGLTSERLRWLCDYACRDDYALRAADTSAWAGLFYFASRQRTAGAAAQSVLTWPDGNHALVRHLATTAAIETGVAVSRVSAAGEVIAIDKAGPFGVRARRVIVAVPSFVRDRIVSSGSASGSAPGASRGDYGAWAVANVHLAARPKELHHAPPAWDNVFRDSPSLGYVSATHQRGRERGPTVWTWYYPFPGDAAQARRQLAGATAADWAEVVVADLERAHPDVRALVDKIEVAFWGHGMIRPRTGALFAGDRAARARPVGQIHFAHTDLSGFALFEEAFDHGLRAAREVAEALA